MRWRPSRARMTRGTLQHLQGLEPNDVAVSYITQSGFTRRGRFRVSLVTRCSPSLDQRSLGSWYVKVMQAICADGSRASASAMRVSSLFKPMSGQRLG